MPHITDSRFEALRAQLPTVPPTTNDLLWEWAGTQGGTGLTLNDRIYSMLIAQGADPLQVNDMWRQVLTLQGFTGSLNDQLKDFWEAGGSFSGSVDDNYLLDDLNIDEYLLDDASADDVWLLDGAPFFVAQDADQYTVSQDFTGPSSTQPRFRYDMRWKPDGTRVFFRYAVGDNNPAVDNLIQFDVSPAWSLNPSNWTNQVSIQIGTDTAARTFEWVNDGTRIVFLAVWFSSFRRMDSFPASTAYDISTLGGADGSFTGLIGGEFGMKWSEDWTQVLISRSAGEWNRYNASTPGDLNTLTGPDQTWSGVGDTVTLAPGELKLYGMSSTNLLSWDLASPFSISPAPTNQVTGPSLNLPTTGGVWRGLNIHPGTGELFAEGDQNAFRLRSWTT